MNNEIKKCLDSELARSPKTTEEPPKLYPDINEAQKTIDAMFKKVNAWHEPVNLENPIDFEDTNIYCDWRNHIGDFKDIWNDLTLNEKKLVYIFCVPLSDDEEWD